MEKIQQCLLASATEYPWRCERCFIVCRQRRGQRLINFLLFAPQHPCKGNREGRERRYLHAGRLQMAMSLSCLLVRGVWMLEATSPLRRVHECARFCSARKQVIDRQIVPMTTRDLFFSRVVSFLAYPIE